MRRSLALPLAILSILGLSERPAEAAEVAFGFDGCPLEIVGNPGAVKSFNVFATLTTTENASGAGVAGWNLSATADGGLITAITVNGVHVNTVFEDDGNPDTPPVNPSDFDLGDATFHPTLLAQHSLDPFRKGAVSGLVMTFEGARWRTLQPEGTARVAKLTVEATVPAELTLRFEDGFQATGGEPVNNVVTIAGSSEAPALGSCTIRLVSEPSDCNENGVADDVDISSGTSKDCNADNIPDECQLPENDCNQNSIPDDCETEGHDCDGNDVPDSCDLSSGTAKDCNTNGIPDSCDIAAGTSKDCDKNAIPDSCDMAGGASTDCNSNGIPDSCDVGGTSSEDCNGNGIGDGCDIVSGSSLDADKSAVPDECEVCLDGEPVQCPGDAGPAFRYSFRGPCRDSGEIGSARELVVFGRIETHCLEAGSDGAQGWSMSVAVEGCRPVEATTQGTAAALTSEGGLRPRDSFETTVIIDPARNAGKMGVVSAVALSLNNPVSLPPEDSPHDVIRLTLAATIPPDCGECVLRYEDGLTVTGEAVSNRITFQRQTRLPLLTEMHIELCPTGGGGSLQKPGDENQDGAFNLSDPVSVLNHLFAGTNPTLPCGDGTLSDPANLAILDLNGSGVIDLSDPVYALNFLFSGGDPPEMGEDCLRVQGCPAGCGG